MHAFLTRRKFLTVSTSAAALSVARPYISRANDRPLITHGVQSGDVGLDSGVIWARTDRPARMQIEIATTESFRDVRRGVFVDALPHADFTAKALVEDLPPGQDIFYRVRFQDHSSPTILSEPAVGRFRTAPAHRRTVSFVWGGDVCGQGWGIDEARGGMRMFATMQKSRPDFFVHSGDTIYSDAPLLAEVKLADGTIWKNVVTEAKSKAAETLDEYRDNYKYNLTDKNVLAMNAEIPVFAQWDDHEVTNNWWPEEPIGARRAPAQEVHREEHAHACRARRQSFPRIHADPCNARGGQPHLPQAFIWAAARRRHARHPQLSRPERREHGAELRTVRVLLRAGPGRMAQAAVEGFTGGVEGDRLRHAACLESHLRFGDRRWGQELLSQGDHGPPRGRELELADILSFIKREKIRNTVWITADVHYAAAHYYDPNKAAFQDFDPFWEFVAGPLHAGTGRVLPPDETFGPQVVFSKGPPPESRINHGPSYGMQFFGHVSIDGASGVMTVSLKDIDDVLLWSRKLEPSKD